MTPYTRTPFEQIEVGATYTIADRRYDTNAPSPWGQRTEHTVSYKPVTVLHKTTAEGGWVLARADQALTWAPTIRRVRPVDSRPDLLIDTAVRQLPLATDTHSVGISTGTVFWLRPFDVLGLWDAEEEQARVLRDNRNAAIWARLESWGLVPARSARSATVDAEALDLLLDELNDLRGRVCRADELAVDASAESVSRLGGVA